MSDFKLENPVVMENAAKLVINYALAGDWDLLSEFEVISHTLRPYVLKEIQQYYEDKLAEYPDDSSIAYLSTNELKDVLADFDLYKRTVKYLEIGRDFNVQATV